MLLNLDKHRNDLVKLTYDLLKIWIAVSIISPFAIGNLNILNFFSYFLIALGLFLIALMIREGGKQL